MFGRATITLGIGSLLVLLFIITPNGSTHKICKSIYKTHTLNNIKRNYKLGIQFM